jgi:putative DNA primase/helicase
MPDTSQQKILLIVGPRRSGKGTIGRILRALVGERNHVAPTLNSLALNFGLQPLLDKTVAVVSDARLNRRDLGNIVVERLLAISGEDALSVDRKHKEVVTKKLLTRFTILTNELPDFKDASGALASRFIILQTTKSFLGQADHELTDRLMNELPQIALWAIRGYQRLKDRKRFIIPDTSIETAAEYEELTSPIKAFVKDRCIFGSGQQVRVEHLFQAYQRWCSENRKKSPEKSQFGRDFHAAYQGQFDRKQVREADGERFWVYDGIGLRCSPKKYGLN